MEKNNNTKKISPIFHILFGLGILFVIGCIVFLIFSSKTTYTPTNVEGSDVLASRNQPISSYSQQLNIQVKAGIVNGGESETLDAKTSDTTAESEYIFEDSDQRELTESEIYALTKEQTRYARNEIYARHGRKFSDEELQNYFDSKSWYTPLYTPEEFDSKGDSIFNEYEFYNKNLIDRIEKELGYK